MRRRVGPTLVCVVGLLLLQSAWVLAVPPFAASDEFDHVYRATSVARGHLLSETAASDGRGGLVVVPRDVVAAAAAECSSLAYTGPDNCRSAGSAGQDDVYVGSGASTYNPVFYGVLGTIARPFHGTTVLYVMRIVGAVLCTAFLGFAAWALPRSPWHRLALVVALSPVLVFSTTVAAPNGIEMAAGVALWAALLRLADDDPPPRPGLLVWGATLATCVLLTVRLLGPLFVLLILGTMALHPRAGSIARRLVADRRRVVSVVSVTAAAAAASLWWIIEAGQTDASTERGPGSGDLRLLDPVVWAAQTIAAFPFRDQPGPAVVYVVVATLVVTLGVGALVTGTARDRALLVAVGAVVLLGPLVLTLLTRDSQGVIWQGRYGLPYAVGMVLLCGAVLARAQAWHLGRAAVAAAGLALAIGSAASVLKVRAGELARPSSAGNAEWWVHSPALLVVLTVTAYAALSLWCASATPDLRATGAAAEPR
ncbi:DUF2142 domain-containing protein [Nocardioides rubriscoriae]|uniref:DUF2142 domain-containing protein n=1 Tax=Nocardioides rubriscoriae TaxID=642762 RepID=UPI001479204A|nr:DUF2142 domain-containing protein [Nocardioides rubriscoriae]